MEWDFYIHRAGSSSSAESIQGRYIKIGMQRWRWSPVYFYESCSVAFLCASSFVPWEKVFFGGISASRDVVITRFITGFKAWRSSLGLESIVLHRHDSTVAQKGQTQHSWLLRGRTREGCNHIAGCHKVFWILKNERSVLFFDIYWTSSWSECFIQLLQHHVR